MSASCDDFEFHTTHRCHSVFSCLDPAASFHERLVARENVATRFPPVVDRTSGSFPRFPINVTLFKLRLTCSSWRSKCLAAHGMIQSTLMRKQIPANQRFVLRYLLFHFTHPASACAAARWRLRRVADSTGVVAQPLRTHATDTAFVLDRSSRGPPDTPLRFHETRRRPAPRPRAVVQPRAPRLPGQPPGSR